MSHQPEHQFPDDLSQVYARLNQLDVEQFYAGYQWWITHQRIIALQEEIDTLRLQINENAQYMQYTRPPAVALATLARLQAHGVDDLDLLDHMLEQGEEWLDLIMQRLDYCERLDFIDDNYTQWCENALEGAYDWIDSMREAGVDKPPLAEASSDMEATEELLLRKLTSEEEGENLMAEPPPAETKLAGEAPFESISLQVAQDSPPEEISEEPGEQELLPTGIEVEAISSLISIESAGEQPVEAAEPSGTAQPANVDAAELVPVSIEQGSEEQTVEFNPTAGASQALNGDAEVEISEISANDVAPQEDRGVDAVQETPFPIEIDSADAVEEPLPTEIDERDTTNEVHSEEKVAEAPAGSEVPLAEEANVESEMSTGDNPAGAAEKSVEESPVVAAPEESASKEREDTEPAPAQDQKQKRRRSFWEFLLEIPGH